MTQPATDNFAASLATKAKEVSSGLPFVNIGVYRLRLDRLVRDNNKLDGKEFVEAQVQIVESSGEGANPPGSPARIRHKRGRYESYYQKDVVNLLAAIGGSTADKLTEAAIIALLGPDQAGKGYEFLVQVYPDSSGKKDPNGEPFRNYLYSAAPPKPAQ